MAALCLLVNQFSAILQYLPGSGQDCACQVVQTLLVHGLIVFNPPLLNSKALCMAPADPGKSSPKGQRRPCVRPGRSPQHGCLMPVGPRLQELLLGETVGQLDSNFDRGQSQGRKKKKKTSFTMKHWKTWALRRPRAMWSLSRGPPPEPHRVRGGPHCLDDA